MPAETVNSQLYSHSQVSVENDLGSDASGNDWVGQDGAKLLCDVEWVHCHHLQGIDCLISAPYYKYSAGSQNSNQACLENHAHLSPSLVSHLAQLHNPAVSSLDGHQRHCHTVCVCVCVRACVQEEEMIV